MSRPQKTLIIGVGNLYRRDDSLGYHFIDQFPDEFCSKDLVLMKSSGEAYRLMECWEGYERVILVDAVAADRPPGSVIRLDVHRDEIPQDLFPYSTHAMGLVQTIELARSLGSLPQQMIILGIVGDDFGSGEGLSDPVAASLPGLYEMLLREREQFRKEGEA